LKTAREGPTAIAQNLKVTRTACLAVNDVGDAMRYLSFKYLTLPARSIFILLGLILAWTALCSRAEADTRVALIIGNSNYANLPRLPNPVNDSQDVASALLRLGFSVTAITDVDFKSFRSTILEFSQIARTADISVVYFAGHGVEMGGENWLLPTDVELLSDSDTETEAIGLRSVIGAVEHSKALGLVILDACRANPFSSTKRSQTANSQGGLAPVEAPGNELVAFAARDGTVASDGNGRNSPFTKSLLRHIETPGLEIDFLFRNIRDDVMAATNNKQQPMVYGSLSTEAIYLKPSQKSLALDSSSPAADEVAWSFLSDTDDVTLLEHFTVQYPKSSHKSQALVRIASLERKASSNAASDSRSADRDQASRKKSLNRAAAISHKFQSDNSAISDAWGVIKESTDHKVIQRFVEQFPSSQRRLTANKRLADLGQRPTNFGVYAADARAEEHSPEKPKTKWSLISKAAKDPDVIDCFKTSNQDACQRATYNYPDIERFRTSELFSICVCENLGKSGRECTPYVQAHWKFSAVAPMNGGASANTGSNVGPSVQTDANIGQNPASSQGQLSTTQQGSNMALGQNPSSSQEQLPTTQQGSNVALGQNPSSSQEQLPTTQGTTPQGPAPSGAPSGPPSARTNGLTANFALHPDSAGAIQPASVFQPGSAPQGSTPKGGTPQGGTPQGGSTTPTSSQGGVPQFHKPQGFRTSNLPVNSGLRIRAARINPSTSGVVTSTAGSRVSSLSTNIKVSPTRGAPVVHVPTANVRVATVRVATVRVPTVRVPTVRVPTVQVRIP